MKVFNSKILDISLKKRLLVSIYEPDGLAQVDECCEVIGSSTCTWDDCPCDIVWASLDVPARLGCQNCTKPIYLATILKMREVPKGFPGEFYFTKTITIHI